VRIERKKQKKCWGEKGYGEYEKACEENRRDSGKGSNGKKCLRRGKWE
jgi:hypothetical protein